MEYVDWNSDDCEIIIPEFEESFSILPTYRSFPEDGESPAFFNMSHRFDALKRVAVSKVSVHGENGNIVSGAAHIHYDSAVLLTSGWWFNYSHFMLDILPMLRATDDLQFDVLLVSPNRAALELLEFFDVDAEVVILSEDVSIGVNKLWLVSPNGPPSLKPGWVVRYLRQNMLPKSDIPPKGKRLWINRNDTSHRQLKCGDNIEPWLKERGFELITASELSVANQVALFSQAEYVSGVHGAGFTNTVFCPRGAGLFEFFDPFWMNGCFRILCGHREMRWDYEIGDPYSSDDHVYCRDVSVTKNIVINKLEQFMS